MSLNRIFENYRHFLTEDEEALLIEGRKDVAMSRAVRGLDNEIIKEFTQAQMERLLDADPSGKQKYANWLANQLNKEVHRSIDYTKDQLRQGMAFEDYIDSVKSSIGSAMTRFVRYLPKYHKLAERNLIEKDINKYEEYTDWEHDIYKAEKELEERERMKAMAKQAKAETDEVDFNEDYMVVRPRSKEGSCYFGQGTKWCISATQSQNYFDSYTSEGKGFYFVFFHHTPQGDPLKKMAMVFEPGFEEPSEVFDAPDDEVGVDGLREAVIMNLLFKGFYGSVMNKKEVRKRLKIQKDFLETIADSFETAMVELREEDVIDPIFIKIFENLGIDLGPESTNEENMPSHAEEAFNELVSEQLWDIQGSAGYHWDRNPAGPTDEDFQKILDAAELKNVWVNWDEYDEGRMYWNGGMAFNFDDVDDLVEDAVDTDQLADLVRENLQSNDIYPDDVEDNSYGGEISVHANFNPGYGEESGLEGFKSFVDRMAEASAAYELVYKDVIEDMKSYGWIPGQSIKALLEKFDEMKFQNFDVDLEDGKVEVSSRLNVKLLLPEELRTGNRELASSGGATRATVDPRKVMWNSIITELKAYENTSAIGNKLVEHLKIAFDRAMNIAAAQMKLPLNEEKGKITVPEFNIQFGALRPKSQGSIGGHDSQGVRRDVKHTISDTYTYWLDVVIEGEETEEEIKTIQRFLRLIDKEKLFEKIRQYTEGLVNKQLQKVIIPKAREEYNKIVATQQVAADAEEEQIDEMKNIFNNWRNFKK